MWVNGAGWTLRWHFFRDIHLWHQLGSLWKRDLFKFYDSLQIFLVKYLWELEALWPFQHAVIYSFIVDNSCEAPSSHFTNLYVHWYLVSIHFVKRGTKPEVLMAVCWLRLVHSTSSIQDITLTCNPPNQMWLAEINLNFSASLVSVCQSASVWITFLHQGGFRSPGTPIYSWEVFNWCVRVALRLVDK